MDHGIRLGRIGGIDVSIDWTLVAIFWLISASLASSQLPHDAPHHSAWAYWLAGVATAAVFLSSLLAHELAHAIAARRAGLEVSGVVLWLLGGLTEIEGEAPTADIELRVAVVGPVTSLGLAAGFGLAAGALHLAGAADLTVAAVTWLAVINAVLGVFNLAPALPLDGGRVLRAVLWRRTGDALRATQRSARIGHSFGVALVAFGLIEFFLAASLAGLWLAFIGWFVLSAAGAQARRAELELALRGVPVRDAMTANPVVAPDWITIDELLGRWAPATRGSTFPLAGPNGALSGLITGGRIKRVPPADRSRVLVRDVACPFADVVVCAPDDQLVEILPKLARSPDQRALVLDGGVLAGILTPTDVDRAAERAGLAASR